MNQMTKFAPVDPVKQLSDEDLNELLEHNRVAYSAAIRAAEHLKQEITLLGREQAKRDGQLIMPSFERILNPIRGAA